MELIAGLPVVGGFLSTVVPFVVVIEVISFLSRPISLSIRLFANLLSGHIALKVFAGFVVSLLACSLLRPGRWSRDLAPFTIRSCALGALKTVIRSPSGAASSRTSIASGPARRAPPFTTNEIIPPGPFLCSFASACCGCEGKPG